jgi:hypothetical protein
MTKKVLAIMAMSLLVAWGVVGSLGSASAGDRVKGLERRISHLENQVESLQDTRRCMDIHDITQYSDYVSVDGDRVTAVDFTRSDLDPVGGVMVLWVCEGSP